MPLPRVCTGARSAETLMELNEVIRRVIGQHWRLIVACFVTGTAVAAVAHGFGSAAYTASTRFLLDTQDSKSLGQATAIADTAKAIATSPSQLGEAMEDAGVRGSDPGNVANRVSIRALGSSAVLELSVTDSDPTIAASLSNALAARIISTRLSATGGDIDQALADVADRIDDLTRRIATADSWLAELDIRLGTAATGAAREALRTRREALVRSREALVQQREVLQSQRPRLVSAAASRPKPAIISSATPPLQADSRGWPPTIMIGLLLGLVAGLGAAALVETMRPTLVGGDVLARELDAPFLGSLAAGDGGEGGRNELATVAGRLQLVARAARIDTIELVAARGDIPLDQLAERLQSIAVVLMPPLAAAQGHSPSRREETAEHRDPEPRVRPFAVGSSAWNRGGAAALVLVAPTALKRAELADLNHLFQVVGLPLLGLITYQRPQPESSRGEPQPGQRHVLR